MDKEPFLDWEQRKALAKALSDPELAHLPLTPKEVSIILQRNEKTLEQDRREQTPADPSYLPYIKSGGKVLYRAGDVAAYLQRGLRVSTRDATAPQVPPVAGSIRGFSTMGDWLRHGGVEDRWAFSMQRDGRPIDLVSAIETSALTGDAAALTLGEFTEQLSSSVARAHFNRQDGELHDDLPKGLTQSLKLSTKN